ncbi:carbohydrate ABC transporter permease [Paenibacillus allorhizosphaerae]|uniref:Melibiose/raffinose/stachyose import permease protein MelC n=1 Tax=Paenibacillus allorhizosphaerae TaxID=2849866 RepID=A0ABM8VA54_9BACL|nr:carbohydrate ABC transporter permease [Paenibacillus allorhizosphaerae]CAG7615485.1 Melibiose/raffinose/stachyose import permease protein MelC [Paenibacillus allorhizosphaerae]
MVRTAYFRRTPLGEMLVDAVLYLIVLLIMFITLFPFWNQVVISLSSGSALYSTEVLLFPKQWTFGSYLVALKYKSLWWGFYNSVVRAAVGVVLSLVFTSMFAYALSKKELPFNSLFTAMILFTMLFSGGLIPHYLLIKNLGLYNSVWALILPSLISAFNVLIMRNFFRSIPEGLEESAKVDGAGYFLIYWKIVIPLSKPVLATVALWVAVTHWNAWFDSLIYISDPHKQVLQVVLRKIIVDNNMDEFNAMLNQVDQRNMFSGRQLQATVIMLSMIPMLVVYPFVQKYFVKGIMLGSVKG